MTDDIDEHDELMHLFAHELWRHLGQLQRRLPDDELVARAFYESALQYAYWTNRIPPWFSIE